MGLKVSSAKWRPFCLGLNVSIQSDKLTQLIAQNQEGDYIINEHY